MPRKTHVLDRNLDKEEWSTSKPRTPLRRTRRETERLETLAAVLDPERDFLVERKVILTTRSQEGDSYTLIDGKMVLTRRGTPRRFELRVFTVRAISGSDAADIANQAKFNLERARGHHTKASS